MSILVCRSHSKEHYINSVGEFCCGSPMVYLYPVRAEPDSYKVNCKRCLVKKSRELAQAWNIEPAQGQLWGDTSLRKTRAGRTVVVEMVLDGLVYYSVRTVAGGKEPNRPSSNRLGLVEFKRRMAYLESY